MEEAELNPTMAQRNILILEIYRTNLISMLQESYFTDYSIEVIHIFNESNGNTLERDKYKR